MTGSVTWLIICILFSMGISLNGTSVGKGLAEAIDEASKNGTYTCSDETMDKVQQEFYEYFDPTNPKYWGEPILTEEDLENISSNITAEDIQRILGNDALEDFIDNNQGNVIDSNVSGIGSHSFGLSNGYSVELYTYYNDDMYGGRGGYDWAVRIVDDNGNVLCDKNDLQMTTLCHYGWAQITDETKAAYLISLFDIDKDGYLYTYSSSGKFMEKISIPRYLKEVHGIDIALDPEKPPEFFPITTNDGTIGKITDVAISGTEIGQLPIAADRSITLPDGTKVYPNSDGTYNIDNRVYSPTYNLRAYDDSALLGLLQQLLQKVGELENKLEFEKEKEEDKELEEKQEEAIEDLEEAAAEAEDVLSQYTYSSTRWANIFPFCIPWDFVRGVKLLSASPVAPKFTIPFEIPEFGSFKGYKTEIVLNFSDYEKYFKPVRWFTTTFFLISLGFITFKIVKGAA